MRNNILRDFPFKENDVQDFLRVCNFKLREFSIIDISKGEHLNIKIRLKCS